MTAQTDERVGRGSGGCGIECKCKEASQVLERWIFGIANVANEECDLVGNLLKP